MAETITMPKLGFDMAEGTLVRWVKAEGENVNKGDVIAEIETDKATVEVESTHSGVMARHLVEQGTVVPVSTPIAIVAEPGEKVDEGAAPAAASGSAAAAGTPAAPGAGASTGGGAVDTGQAVQPAVQKPDAASMESKGPAPKPESPITATDVTGGKAPTSELPATAGEQVAAGAESPASGDGQPQGKQFATPLARKVAADRGVDLATVQGSGPNGRIRRKDVEAAAERGPVQPSVAPAAQPATVQPQAQPQARPEVKPVAFSQVGELKTLPDQEIAVNRLRAAIGRRMTESKQQLPHFYVTYDYNAAPLLALRKQVNEFLPDEQKLTVNDFIVKAVALALRQFPNINASLKGDKIVRHGAINVGVAVAVEGGLMTIVTRNTDLKPIGQLSAEIKDLVGRARVGKVRPDDIEGSTFSISNLGMFGVDDFLAIINPPEAAILSVSAAKQVPVVENGEIKVGTRMKMTISADHRVTDGAEAAQFMQALAGFIEQPVRLML